MLRKDLEEAHIQQESTLVGLKKKHQDAIAEMTEQIDQLTKMKSKIEKAKQQIMHEIADVRAATDEVHRSAASAEKSHRNLLASLNDLGKKVEEGNLTLGDFEAAKRKMAAENGDLLRQLQELETAANMLTKTKSALAAQLDEQRIIADDVAKDRQSLLGKFRNAEHDVDGMKEHFDEEVSAKENLMRQLNKAQGESDMWRTRYEKDGVGKAEELEMSRLKMQARLSEAESTVGQLNSKLAQVEKAKAKLQSELDGMGVQLDQARTLLEQADRARRMVEQELADTNETLGDQTCTNQSIQGGKMKLDSEMQTLSCDLDEMASEASLSEEKAQKAMIDAARLADELRSEQECAQTLERDRKLLEAQVKDLQARLDDAEQNALKGGKKAMGKMDTRIRELESELDAENRRMADAQKGLRKSERKIKELTYAQDEDRKNHERMQALI